MFAQYIRDGGPVMWPIMGLGGVAALFVLERVFYWVRYALRRDSGLRRNILDGRLDHLPPITRDPVADVAYWFRADPERGRMMAERLVADSRRGTAVLRTLASISTSLGLFGTVVGVSLCLDSMAAGKSPDMAHRLAVALYTTVAGLIVYLGCHAAIAIFTHLSEGLQGELDFASKAPRLPVAVPMAAPVTPYRPQFVMIQSAPVVHRNPTLVPVARRVKRRHVPPDMSLVHTMKSAAVFAVCSLVSLVLHAGLLYMAMRVHFKGSTHTAKANDGSFIASVRDVLSMADTTRVEPEPPKAEPPKPEPEPEPPKPEPKEEAPKPEEATTEAVVGRKASEVPNPPAKQEPVEREEAPPAPREASPEPPPPAAAKSEGLPKKTEEPVKAAAPPPKVTENPGAAAKTAPPVKIDDVPPPAAEKPRVGVGGATPDVDAQGRIASLNGYRKFIQSEMKSGASEGAYIPKIRFGDNTVDENRAIMKYYGMELIAYPSNMKFYVYIDPDQNLYSKSSEFDYVRNFSTRVIYRSSPYFDGLRREAARRHGLKADDLVVAQLLKPASAAYLAWKEAETAKRAGVKIEDVDRCEATFVKTTFGAWIIRIDALVMRDGRSVAVKDFESERVSTTTNGGGR